MDISSLSSLILLVMLSGCLPLIIGQLVCIAKKVPVTSKDFQRLCSQGS